MASEALNLRNWTEADVLAFLPSVEASPFGPLEGVSDVLDGSALFEFNQEQRKALAAVRPVQLQYGKRLDVVGLVSLGDRLHRADLLAVDDAAAMLACDMATICTRHPHLTKALEKAGWQITGFVMAKRYQRVQQ